MEEKQPIRILHFSDFHLNGNNITESKNLLQYMLNSIKKNNIEVDLILFSGDMIDQGGISFNNGIKEAFDSFERLVIEPTCNALNLSKDKFIITPGNHDVDHLKLSAIEKNADKTVETEWMISEAKVAEFINKQPELLSISQKRFADVQSFIDSLYKTTYGDNYKNDGLTSSYVLTINGCKVGIASLNTIWRCNDNSFSFQKVLGKEQIDKSYPFIQDCEVKIAITHYNFSFWAEWEKEDDIDDMLKRNYDLFFSGHTHKCKTEPIENDKGDFCMSVVAAGTLTNNKYSSINKYKNAFQIVEYYPNESIKITVYQQNDGQFFNQDMTYGNNNGYYLKKIPTRQDVINEQAVIKEKEKIDSNIEFINKIAPFSTIKGQIQKIADSFFKKNFITCKKIDEIIATLRDTNINFIHFLALSGMGKTRIVMEAFKNDDNVYYSPSANCTDQLRTLVEKEKECTIIVDDCDNDQRRELKKIIKTYGNNRLITINNELSFDEELVDGDILIKFDYEEAADIITKLIDNEKTLKPDEVSIIKEYAGNIPYMAILLIDAYLNNKTLKISNGDSLLSALLRGRKSKDEKQEKVLKSIALFNPLGYSGVVSDEYNYVKNNKDIHHIPENQSIVDLTFQDTLKTYLEKRKLIEYKGDCIRVRPKPLAEWLTDYWLTEYGDSIPKIWDELQKRNDPMAQRIMRAFCARIKDMTEYAHAKELFDKMHDTCSGSFHDERIAFSDEGSQLFLSMGMVSPVAVSRNLLSLLENKSNDIEWIKNNVADETRRNLVRAFEIMSVNADSFPYSAKALMILSIAENETYANNATRQFAQLFHCFLSGTKATLQMRVKVLEDYIDKDEYTPLIIRAIDAALKSRDFHRFITPKEQLLIGNPDDYRPKISDVVDYWNRCSVLLISISKRTEKYDESSKKIITQHVSDLYNWNCGDILDNLLTYFGDKCDYNWPEIRKNLRYYINYWGKNDKANIEKATEWYNRFSPKLYLIRVKDTIDNRYTEERKDFNQFYDDMYELMEPFAQEFVEKKIYQTDEMSTMLHDWEFQSHWLIRKIVEVIGDKNALIQDVFDSIISIVKKEETTFESPFITQFCIEIIGKEDDNKMKIVKGFQKTLYDNNYCRLSASVEGSLDDKNHSLLSKVIKDVISGKYDNYCINNYLHRYRWHDSIDSIVSITEELIKGNIDQAEVIFPYFTDYLRFNDLSNLNENVLDKIESILLSYSFISKSYNTGHQVVETIQDILRIYHRPIFALNVHKKVVAVLSSRDSYIDSPFDTVYDTLLPKYQDAILNQLCEDIAADDNRFIYYWKIHYDLGSGFSYGVGPLFKCDYKLLKEACLRYPKTLPSRMAQMCPVEEPNKEPSETFFWWLCENFGDDKAMLDEFSSNMGTYSYAGTAKASFADFIEQRVNLLSPYLKHPNKNVQEWAKKQIEFVRKEVKMERDNEEYRKMLSD